MHSKTISIFLTAIFLLSLTSAILARPASEEVIQLLKDEGRFEQFVESMREARARGVNSAVSDDGKGRASFKSSPDETFKVLVLLIDFPNKLYTSGWTAGSTADFDSLLFSDNLNPTGSMKEFYIENSYGNFVLEGDVAGWYTAANDYEYYTNFCDGSHGTGPYPNNSQRLVQEAVIAANPDIDFTKYDNDGNGYVDGIFVVHAGTGREETGNDCEIHSHKWQLPGTGTIVDGVRVTTYSIEPEETPNPGGLIPIGVFCHEFGHVLGLPDLYDTDYSSRGCGKWAVMAGGSSNGNSQTPSQFICWSKYKLGWLNPINVTSNMTDVDLLSIEDNPVSYRLWRNGTIGNQYFMVANRQRIGFDTYLPGDGLLIWHIDDAVSGNTNDWHPLVMLEQADGDFHLQNDQNSGDGQDAFPNSGYSPNFNDKTNPGSRDYTNFQTQVAVWNIPTSNTTMTVDLDINWSRPFITMDSYTFSDVTGGDGDGILEAGESIELTCSFSNEWKDATSADLSLSIDDGTINITTSNISLGTIPSGGSANNSGSPLVFEVPVNYVARIDSFFLEISSDGGQFVIVLPIEQNVGSSPILLVDDDNNDNLESYYKNVWYEKRIPSDLWNKAQSGSPSISDLSPYDVVVWFTGDDRPSPLTAGDITAMQNYMDAGGNLFLTGQGIAGQLDTFDPTFLSDYLHSEYLMTGMIPLLVVDPGSQVFAGFGDSLAISGYGGASNQSGPDRIDTINGGVPEILYFNTSYLGAVSYSGAYKMVFFSFGFEAVSNDPVRFARQGEIMDRILNFFGVTAASGFPEVTDVSVGPGYALNLIDHTPDISWSYYDEGAAPQVNYQIQVGTDNDWSVAEMWNYSPGSGSETTLEYFGSTLGDGQSYFYRVRVNNGLQWSNWMSDQFNMNSLPGIPGGLVPDGLAGLVTDTPELTGDNAFNSDGGTMTYSFELFDDDQLTNLVTQVSGVSDGVGTTSWTVDVSLSDDQVYYWRMRSFDSYEYGAWSDSALFWVNAVNDLPTAFDLLLPADGILLETMQPTLHWGKSFAGDLFDTISYTLMIDTALSFSDPLVIGSLSDTSHTLAVPLAEGYGYYWKVVAADQFGGQLESSAVFEMAGFVPGDANSDGAANVGDAVFLINYVFKSGDAPEPLKAGDANADCLTNVGDAVYLINFVFKSGDAPMVGCS